MIDRNNLRCTAFHEAGHAVAAAVLGIPLERVFIVRDIDHAARPVGQQLGQVVRNFQKTELAGKEDLAALLALTPRSEAGVVVRTRSFFGAFGFASPFVPTVAVSAFPVAVAPDGVAQASEEAARGAGNGAGAGVAVV